MRHDQPRLKNLRKHYTEVKTSRETKKKRNIEKTVAFCSINFIGIINNTTGDGTLLHDYLLNSFSSLERNLTALNQHYIVPLIIALTSRVIRSIRVKCERSEFVRKILRCREQVKIRKCF